MKKGFTIALAGNPNSGKTTIFNNLTGSKQHVGNYPGVTVEKKTGARNFGGYDIKIVDLPGTYSLTAYSLDEVVARNYIVNEKPDVVIDIIDSSNLERNLYLATQLMELGVPLIFAFNMSDILKRSGNKLDIKVLSDLMGVPVVETIGSKQQGMEELLEEIVNVFEKKDAKSRIIHYGEEVENEIEKIRELLESEEKLKQAFNPRWIAVKLLEQDEEIVKSISGLIGDKNFDDIDKQVQKSIVHITTILRDPPETIIADARYGYINGALMEASFEIDPGKVPLSDRIDQIVTNRILGFPIFALVMWLMFQFVFTIGAYPMRWIDLGFNKLGGLLTNVIPDGLLQSLLVDGIIGGVGGVLAFTPNIMLLFICIAILEDSGYMARVAFVMDRIMHKIGLHGKSFIPMLIGFGCTIPAYMGARILESRKDRLVTMHINTFMSCGGRLPVYILLAGAFFPAYAGNVIFSIYFLGIIVAVLMAKLLRATRFKGEAAPFVMELPPYRVPTFKGIMHHMWERTWLYIKKAGTVILAISVVLWVLFTFPRIGNNYSTDYDEQIYRVEQSFENGVIAEEAYNEEISSIEMQRSSEELQYSAAGRIGKFISPVFKPLGFDWRMTVAAVSGVAAKEVVVSSLGTLFSISESGDSTQTLQDSLSEAYHPLVGYNFMIFILLYFPCLASMAVFRREAGWKEMFFQIGYTLLLAWTVAFVVFQVGRLFI